MRRRSMATKLYCRTNGCTSVLELHPERGTAVCPVCGYTRRLDGAGRPGSVQVGVDRLRSSLTHIAVRSLGASPVALP